MSAVTGAFDIVSSGGGAPGIISAVFSCSAPFDGSGWGVVRLIWRRRRERRVVRVVRWTRGACIVAVVNESRSAFTENRVFTLGWG